MVLQRIDDAMASDLWEGRLSVIELVQELLLDIPAEKTVERLVEILARLARDSKWEIRRAVVPALVDVRRPAATNVIDRLTGDGNQWVRQAAKRAIRKLSRITTPAAKVDRRVRFAFDTIKNLDGGSPEKVYDAALLIGEKYYEELAGDTAHELNTYQTAMEGLLQELEHRVESGNGVMADTSEIFGKIRDRSQYLKTLVNGLLEYSRDADLEFQLLSLRPLVSEALDLAREKASTYLGDQEVEEMLLIPTEIMLEACRDRLVQALANILSNAFESFSKKGHDARVEIAVETHGTGRLSLTVTDTGCGMDASQVESATKRFRSLKKMHGGIGLGLPLALKIIKQEHGGRLDIKSHFGVGTTITIELPTRREGQEDGV